MSTNLVRYDLKGSVAVLQLDDGKANAISPEMAGAIHTALDRAEQEAKAIVLAGRPGRFSGGFDLKVMRQGPDAAGPLVMAGGELALRLYGYPLPIVVACTGHAIAMGAFLVLIGDYRLGLEGDFKIGFNEVAIGIPVPIFGIELARDRIQNTVLSRATLTAEIFQHEAAAQLGFFDRISSADKLLDDAMAEAERLVALDTTALAQTKLRLRSGMIARVRETLAEDIKRLVGAK